MSLFGSLLGDKDLQNIEGKIDDIFSQIPNLDAGVSSPEDITGSVLDSVISNSEQDEITRLFESINIPYERIQRYGVYEEINRAVPIIKRIIRVYIANILQKNPVDGKCILFKNKKGISEDQQEKSKLVLNYTKKIFDKFKLTDKIKNRILPIKLLYGDSFFEIVQVDKEIKKIKVSDVFALNEAKSLNEEISSLNKYKTNSIDHKLDTILERMSSLLLVEDDEIPIEDEKNIEDKNKDKYDLFNIILRFHKPNDIIILENEFGTTVGYLQIQQYTADFASVTDISKVLSQTVGRVSSISQQTNVDSSELINKLIVHMLKKVLKKDANNLDNKSIDSVLKNLDEDTYQIIRRIIVEQDVTKKRKYQRVKVRFISPENMIHFQIPSIDNFPYGESVIDSLVFPSKLYILAQLSNTISKLSRAALIRKWTLDTGPLQMQSAQIQKLKRELYNTRVTLHDLSSFKSIPKILSDYKDIFLLSKGGQRALDVEVQSLGDPSIKVADLEDSRREIIALSGIPSTYLGYADVVELREQLVHINVSFATEIIDLQETISKGLMKLIDRIAKLDNQEFKPSDYIDVTLIPPVVLILQLIEMTLASVGNIAGTFQQMNLLFDPYMFLKQYIPFIDWDEFKDSAAKFDSESKSKTKLTNLENPEGGGGY